MREKAERQRQSESGVSESTHGAMPPTQRKTWRRRAEISISLRLLHPNQTVAHRKVGHAGLLSDVDREKDDVADAGGAHPADVEDAALLHPVRNERADDREDAGCPERKVLVRGWLREDDLCELAEHVRRSRQKHALRDVERSELADDGWAEEGERVCGRARESVLSCAAPYMRKRAHKAGRQCQCR